MFQDEANIYIKSGDGGDGMISFRREKYVPLGGPDGGDGGRGGNIIFVVNPKLNSLNPVKRKVHYKAKNGGNGGRTQKTGANGTDLKVEVPPGTVIRNRETGALLAELVQESDETIVLNGGIGGRGNMRFVSSVNRAPRMAERGEPGKELWVSLELKLIADVGLVGLPNAGKSTLLSVVSAAKPKIAAYPFTTITPNLGVVPIGEYDTIVIADIPGLIGGASSGAGLGHTFL
ncbi:MAG: GTPase ObgE, partial [Chloroflexota bacterium]